MELHNDDLRPRYQLCRAGFGLIALSLGLLCAAKVSFLALLFGAHKEVMALHSHPAWLWLVDAPITWGSLVGAYLLWGRWKIPSWQRKAGLLLLMNALDAGMWTIDHAEQFGFEITRLDLDWTFFVVASGLGWVELMMAAFLAAELCAHLGRHDAVDSSRAAHSLAIIGIVFWGILALSQTDWNAWPLRPRMTAEIQILLLLSTVLMIILTFQVTVLSLTASRLCGGYLKELDQFESSGHDLLKSRSETEGDEFFWKD